MSDGLDWLRRLGAQSQSPPMPATIPSPLDTTQAGAISQARTQYPFMAGQVLLPTSKQGGEGWSIGETGDPSYPRPQGIPLNQAGAEVGPGSTPADVAGEALHADPVANLARQRLLNSLSPTQAAYLKHASLDYGTPGPSSDEQQHAWNNAADSAIRGSVANQWPQSAIDGMQYTPAQNAIIDDLNGYMRTGKIPTSLMQRLNKK